MFLHMAYLEIQYGLWWEQAQENYLYYLHNRTTGKLPLVTWSGVPYFNSDMNIAFS